MIPGESPDEKEAMSISKTFKSACVLSAMLISVPVWAANEGNAQATAEKTARTEVYGEPYSASHLVKEGQRRLVVYRMAKDGSDKEVHRSQWQCVHGVPIQR